jgi:hypothetical protein
MPKLIWVWTVFRIRIHWFRMRIQAVAESRSWFRRRIFFFKNCHICLNPDRGQLGQLCSRSGLQPNREPFKHKNLLIFPFLGDNFDRLDPEPIWIRIQSGGICDPKHWFCKVECIAPIYRPSFREHKPKTGPINSVIELVGAYSACRGGAARSGSSPSGPSLSGNRSRPDYPEHLCTIDLFFNMLIFSHLLTCRVWVRIRYTIAKECPVN